jgi:predicted transcriptional regulator
MLKLFEYGELNQSKLISYCGLNNAKHREIIDDMVEKDLITRTEESWGAKTITKYMISEKGMEILRKVLEPYEALFPRVSERKSITHILVEKGKNQLWPMQKLSSVAVP